MSRSTTGLCGCTSVSDSRSPRTRASTSCSSGRRLGEDRLVALTDLVGSDRDEEDLERAELVVLDAVDALSEWRVRAAPEDERKLLARRRRGVALGNFEELDLECRLRLGR